MIADNTTDQFLLPASRSPPSSGRGGARSRRLSMAVVRRAASRASSRCDAGVALRVSAVLEPFDMSVTAA